MSAEREAELVRRAACGDRDAFSALLERYQNPLVAFACRYLGSREDAEDAAQETLIRVYFTLHRLRQPDRFAAYLFTAALNACRKRARASRPAPEPGAPAESPEVALLRTEERERLGKAIAGLPDDYREVVSLRAAEDLSFAEIAQVLGISEGACRVRFHRAKERLRAALGVPAEATGETA